MQKSKSSIYKVRVSILSASVFVLLLLGIFPNGSSIAVAATSPKCPGQQGYFYTNDKSKRNPRKGGFVSESANVGDYVFIAPTAAVCDSASVLEFARVYGNAVVKDESEVTDKARVYGDAVVSGEAVVAEEAKVSGNAHVTGSAEIRGKAWVKGYRVVSDGTLTKGKHSSKKPKAVAEKEQRIAAAASREKDRQNKEKMMRDAKDELKRIQRKLKQGWFGENKQQGYYRSFEYSKSDVKPPCGFYLRLTKEQKTLDSHCRRTKQVRRKIWSPSKGHFDTVKDCKTQYEDQGEKFFNFKKLKVGVHTDFGNDRNYLELNGYYFYIQGGNRRKIQEYGNELKAFAAKYCQ